MAVRCPFAGRDPAIGREPLAIRTMKLVHLLGLAPLLLAPAAPAQIYDYTGRAGTTPLWSDPAAWSPAGPPPNGANVRIIGDAVQAPPGYQLAGPAFDTSATIGNLQMFNGAGLGSGFAGAPDFPGVNLTVTGQTEITGGGYVVAINGCTYTFGTLAQQGFGGVFSAPFVAFSDHAGLTTPAVIQWHAANIVRNEGYFVLSGPNSHLRDQDTGLDALRFFNVNGGSINVAGHTFLTPGAFTNAGFIQVFAFGPGFSRFQTGGNFVNYDSGSHVLNGGFLLVQGFGGGRSEFAFPGADIQTVSSGTVIVLEGDAGIVDSISGANGLRNLGSVGGTLSIANALGVTPAGGVLQQVGGDLNVRSNGALTVIGDFDQYVGASTHVGQDGSAPSHLIVQGTLAVAGAFFFTPAPVPVFPSVIEVTAMVIGDSGIGTGTGDCFGDLMINGTCWPGTPPFLPEPRPAQRALQARTAGFRMVAPDRTPGVSFAGHPALQSRPAGGTAAPGTWRVSGNVSFGPKATLGVTIGGLAAGAGHSQVSLGAGGTASLDGNLSVSVAPGYFPPGSAEFSILLADQISGTFANALPGARLVTYEGEGSFAVTYIRTPGASRVVLSDYQGPSGVATVFQGLDSKLSDDWAQSANWTLDVPGLQQSDAVIPLGFDTRAASDFTQLGTLTLRGNLALEGSTRLEFGQVDLDCTLASSPTISPSGSGNGTLAAHRLLAVSQLYAFQNAFVAAGLTIRPAGTLPLPMRISMTGAGTLYVDADIMPYRDAELTLRASANGTLRVAGTIGEAASSLPAAGGASVRIEGSGPVFLSGANTYTGPTLVQNSLTDLGGGAAALSGGLYAQNTTGSATGSGPVRLVTDPTGLAGFSNPGILGGNGHIAGDVTAEGAYLFPGNGPAGVTDTLTLGGNLTLTFDNAGTGFIAASILLDLDPRAADPARRTDRILLTSPTAAVALTAANLAPFLHSPPVAGQVLRFLDAPNAGPGAIAGTFRGLPPGATLTTNLGGVDFAFEVQYGPNYVQLAHLTPPAVSYAYLRTFYFTESELAEATTSPLADFNADGISNLLAYALGADPKQFPTGRLPQASTRSIAGVPYGVTEIRRAIPLRPDLQYLVAEATNLTAGFGAAFDIDAPANSARVFSRTDNGDGTETIVIRASAPLSEGQRFLRFALNYVP